MTPTGITTLSALLEDTSVQLEFSAVSWGWSYVILLGFLLYTRQFKAVAAGAGIVLVLAIAAGTL